MIKNPVYIYRADDKDEYSHGNRIYCLEVSGARYYLMKEEVMHRVEDCERMYSTYGQTIAVVLEIPNMSRGRLLTKEEISDIKIPMLERFLK